MAFNIRILGVLYKRLKNVPSYILHVFVKRSLPIDYICSFLNFCRRYSYLCVESSIGVRDREDYYELINKNNIPIAIRPFRKRSKIKP